MIHFALVAHFQIPLDLPHAGRIADRILVLLERHTEEMGMEGEGVLGVATRLSNLLFRYSVSDDNPPQAAKIRDEAAILGRELVDAVQAAQISGDRLGQLVRNLFECLELGEEGARISLRAGENPNSLQRPT